MPHTIDVLYALIKEYIEEKLISDKSRILFVDDGSSDSTWQLIYKASIHNENIRGLKLHEMPVIKMPY